VAVDNTFATPYLQQPFRFGADFVVHSTTKFLNGHGTAIGGVLIGRDIELMNTKVTKHHRLLGANSNAFDAFLLTNGLKTLELRMERHCANAEKVAAFLDQHDKVDFVNYLGLAKHPDAALCQQQMRHAGALLSFEIKGGLEGGKEFLRRLKVCTHAVSLGTCDTLISHPASTTHTGVARELRIQSGITDGLIRMSVGLENVQDILDDLTQALAF
jgi:methionine-gamma-lyase